MKKIKIFIIMLICLFTINVKAAEIISHKVMVTNKDGAICYEEESLGKYRKTNKVIPYKATYLVNNDFFNKSYMIIYDEKNEEDNCIVKYSDISAVKQDFSLNSDGVEKITSVKAVILASGGLNMRKGPSVTYSKIITIPQYTTITLTHKAGTYWYYCEYDGKSGWITGKDYYFGYEGKEVLYSNYPIDIYSKDKKVGTIPANTEITDYLNLVHTEDEWGHYVIYNGTKGYISDMLYKTDKVGKIKITKDYEIKNEDGIFEDKLRTNQELEYSMISSKGEFYLTKKNKLVSIPKEYYDYIVKADAKVKDRGYIGEELFGEKKEERPDLKKEILEQESLTIPKENNKGTSIRDILIIVLLVGIFIVLVALVTIKVINNKKKSNVKVIDKPNIPEVTDSEIEKAREIIRRETDNYEPAHGRLENEETNNENEE